VYNIGAAALANGTRSDIINLFKFAAKMGGRTCVNLWTYGAFYEDGHVGDEEYRIDVSIDSEFIQGLMVRYNVPWSSLYAINNDSYQGQIITHHYTARVLDYYPHEDILMSYQEINYADWTSVGTFTISKVTNVNICCVADNGIEIYSSDSSAPEDKMSGCANVARILFPGTYTVYLKGSGLVAELTVRY
jgi:hypothetical protein